MFRKAEWPLDEAKGIWNKIRWNSWPRSRYWMNTVNASSFCMSICNSICKHLSSFLVVISILLHLHRSFLVGKSEGGEMNMRSHENWPPGPGLASAFSCYVLYKLVESGEGEFPFVHSLHGAVKSCTHLVHRSHWLKININHMVGIRKYMKDYERVWKYHHEFIMYTCTSTYNIIQLPGNSWCTINSYIISHTTDYHLSESIPVQWLRLWKLQTQSTTPLGSWRWRTSRWRWAHRPQYVDWYRNIWGINWYQLQSTTIYIYYI